MKRKSFVALCTASFLLSPLGVTVAAPTTVQAATQSTPRYPGQIIQEGSTGTAVKAIQTQLNKLGYSCGTADGIFGPKTKSAVERFQKAMKITVDGQVGPQTWSKLFGTSSSSASGSSTPSTVRKSSSSSSSGRNSSASGSTPTSSSSAPAYPGTVIQEGATGTAVKEIQNQLNHLGYNCGTADGDFGPMTVAAVKSFQQSKGLTVDGQVGPQTWNALFGITTSTVSLSYEAYYSSSAGTLTGAKYSSLATAESHKADGFVVNLASNTIVDMPSQYYHEVNGQWYMNLNGIDFFRSSTVPSFAKPNVLYFATNTQDSPHYVNYYVLSDHKNSSGVPVFNGAFAGKWENPYRTAPLVSKAPESASTIDAWLGSHGYALYGLGSSMIDAQNGYGVNATYLMAHAVEESAGGNSSIALAKNNIYGYGAYDSNPASLAGIFPSEDYAIHYQAYMVRTSYLDPSGPFYDATTGGTLDGMNEHYATDDNWSPTIAAVVNQFMVDEHVSTFATSASVPTISTVKNEGEPIYLTNGAQGQFGGNAQLNLLAYPGQLQQNAQGAGVRALQTLLILNGYSVGSSGADGDFGPATFSALKEFQASTPGLTANGICDVTTWNALTKGLPSSVSVSAIRIGFVGGVVVDLYQVPQVNGQGSVWIDGRYVHLTNVYRVVPKGVAPGSSAYAKEAEISSTLHAGDYVVASSPSSSTVQYSYQQYTGSDNVVVPASATINTSQYELVPYDEAVSQW
ncbi:peptidoglycan-binding protein [Alicyclobacillus pomorum]|uniref:peptidoglycan-binding protein n=1 Tax=Alicyclobacillus pomorum TaxID=204470 RepID=UPI000407D014|nr:peptidoglycan-binding protein [Alicyclobacillus pomorum]